MTFWFSWKYKKKQGSLGAVTIINSHVANTKKYLKIHRFIL